MTGKTVPWKNGARASTVRPRRGFPLETAGGAPVVGPSFSDPRFYLRPRDQSLSMAFVVARDTVLARGGGWTYPAQWPRWRGSAVSTESIEFALEGPGSNPARSIRRRSRQDRGWTRCVGRTRLIGIIRVSIEKHDDSILSGICTIT